MADIKISQLGAAIAVGDTDLVPIVSGGNTLKATAAQVKEHSIGNTNISSIGDGSVTGAISALNTDKQPKTLATPLTIGGVSKTTVEDALGGLVSENQTLANSIAPTEDGTYYSKTYYKGDKFYRSGILRKLTASSVNSSTAISSADFTNADSVTEQIDSKIDKSWKLLGGINDHTSVHPPEGATELLINVGLANDVEFVKVIPLSAFSTSTWAILYIDGYYYSSSDYCYINADIRHGDFRIRNYYKNGSAANYYGSAYYR